MPKMNRERAQPARRGATDQVSIKSACLLTGSPGSGKTTIVKEVVRTKGVSAGGFFTSEIRTAGKREGFTITAIDGESAVLAHIGIRSPHRVGRYGVDLGALERVGVPAIRRAISEHDLVVVDEIGQMEIFSPHFRQAAWDAIESGKRVLGTIMKKPHPWADRLKAHPAVQLILVDRKHQQEIVARLLAW